MSLIKKFLVCLALCLISFVGCANCVHQASLVNAKNDEIVYVPVLVHTRSKYRMEDEIEVFSEWMVIAEKAFQTSNIRFDVIAFVPDSPQVERRIEVTTLDFDGSVVNVYLQDEIFQHKKIPPYPKEDPRVSGTTHIIKGDRQCDRMISIASGIDPDGVEWPNEYTLAHEFGHFFELGHRYGIQDATNIMFQPSRIPNEESSFDREQIEFMNKEATQWYETCVASNAWDFILF